MYHLDPATGPPIKMPDDGRAAAPGARIGMETPLVHATAFTSFGVAQFVGMSEKMVEEVYGHHDPNFQSEIAEGAGKIGKRRK